MKIALVITIKHILNESILGEKKRKNQKVKCEKMTSMFLSEVDPQIFILTSIFLLDSRFIYPAAD